MGNSFDRVYGHFIGGEWVESASGETFESINPATGEVLARVQSGNAQDIDRAVEAAMEAFAEWKKTTAAERSKLLWEVAARLEARGKELAYLETLDTGRPIRETTSSVLSFCVDHYRFYAGAARSLVGESFVVRDNNFYTVREPFGVVGAITPWNGPLQMMAIKVAPALAAGNTVVLKPAEQACLSVLEFAKDIAGLLPKGVLNIVTGFGPTAGTPLVRHPGVRKISFTGEIATAQKILEMSAQKIIPATVELGGKGPHIIFPDADLEAAIEGAMMGGFLNAGQACALGTRLFLHKDIYDQFLEKLVARTRRIRVGDPLKSETQMGPLISKEQLERVMGYIRSGLEEGAQILCGGHQPEDPELKGGFFIEPTILGGVKNTMRVAQEEIFGPVLSVIEWDDYDEMIRQANDVIYGLAAGIWTRDLRAAHRTASLLEVGAVWINRFPNICSGAPFGGCKMSGFGREMAVETLKEYTQTKTVAVNLSTGPLGFYS
jgi:acyl-CoA reductase-like NAD-dependent aldehyde dehydrogenase